jgi:mono/diheme cytochrome c family protein
VPVSARARWWVVVLAVGAIIAAGCDTTSDTADDATVARGAELYDTHCIACHGGATGGSIDDIPPPHNAEGHTWHHADCQLIEITRDGLPPRPGYPEMPGFGDRLSEGEIEAILAHVKTWWEPDQLEFQAELTEEVCD